MDNALRRKRADSSLRLTLLKRKKTTERLDESIGDKQQSAGDNYIPSRYVGVAGVDTRSFFELRTGSTYAEHRRRKLASPSPSVLSQIQAVNRSTSEAALVYQSQADNNEKREPNSDVALADIGCGFERLNLARPAPPALPSTPPPRSLAFLQKQQRDRDRNRNIAAAKLPPQPHSQSLHSTTLPATESESSRSSSPFFPPRSILTYTPSPFSTPTHKPRRPRIITTMMSRRVANLPTGKGGAPTAIPQFVSSGTNLSTDSNNSDISVRTQVPGSYHDNTLHNAQNNAYTYNRNEQPAVGTTRENEAYYGQLHNGLPFATPDLNSSSTFESVIPASHARGLNPNSRAFEPPAEGYGSQYGGSQFGSPSMGHATPKAAGYAGVNNGYATQLKFSAGYGAQHSGYGAPQQGKMSDYGVPASGGNGIWDRRGEMGGYQQQNGYGQGMGAGQYQGGNAYGASQNGGPPPHGYSGSQNGNPYAHFRQGGGMNGYGYLGNGQVDNGYANASSYAVGDPTQNYQNGQYGSASGDGYQQQGQTWGGQYQAQNQYPVQAPGPYVQPSNANRGKSAYYSKPNTAAAPYNPSNLATAPVVNYNQGGRNPEYNYEAQNGGSVQAPSRVNSASPSKSKTSTANSSAELSSSQPSNTSGEQVPGPGSPTPVARRPQEFSSEPRNSRTPTLRSRRGQNIIPSTDPSTKQALANWLENISEIPPPKMLSLDTSNSNLSGGDILAALQAAGGNLTSFNGGAARNDADPFVASRPTPTKLAINPFAPPQHLNPFMGGGLLPKPAVSAPLRRLTANGKPTIGDALEPVNLPFVEYCRLAREDTWGVIKIKNIPYSVNRPEVLAFLGRNARIISEQDFEPVHIVMERVTSKTLDCYVEFINFNEAVSAVNRFETNRTGGRGGRLGQRHVEVELSSQEQLMRDLFPKAKNVTWSGSRPIIKPRDLNDKFNSGFQGFISKEELVMMVKHVEAPQRSPFSKDCPQRPFECLISTLLKYPWYMVDYITIEDRTQLHKVTLQLIDLLQERLNSDHNEDINLTPMLLKRVWRAALKCPGFSPAMKDDICWKCGIDDQMASEMGVPTYAAFWKDLWTIGPKPNAPSDIILYYAALIRETIGSKAELTLAQKAAKGHQSVHPSLFGELVKLIDLPKNGEEFQSLTLSQCASAEWAAIENALRRALTPALTAGPSH